LIERKRWGLFALCIFLSSLAFWSPLSGLFRLSLQDETYSYIPVIPLIVCWLFYAERNQKSDSAPISWAPCTPFLASAVLATIWARRCTTCSSVNQLSIYILALILIWISAFILFMGTPKSRSSLFSLGFLVLLIPIPDFLLSRFIYWLQSGSAEIAEVIFNLSGAPVLREGFIFRLPRISIDVAPECSGIRSSMALLVLALLLAHFAFRPAWKKIIFVLAGLLMMLLKNGIRIATLTLLANYVNPDFLYGNLHHRGGVVFFVIGLILLVPLFWYLRKGEVHQVST